LLSIFTSTNATETEDFDKATESDENLYILEGSEDDDEMLDSEPVLKMKDEKVFKRQKGWMSEKSDYFPESYFDMLYALLDLRSLAHKIVDPLDKFIEQKIIVEPMNYMHPYPVLPVSQNYHSGYVENSIPLPPPRPKPFRSQYDKPLEDTWKRYFSGLNQLLSWDRSAKVSSEDLKQEKCKYYDKAVCEYLEKNRI